jgi:hypothetical protein
MGCTQKAEVLKYLENFKVLENYKNLVPPLMNSEIGTIHMSMFNKET